MSDSAQPVFTEVRVKSKKLRYQGTLRASAIVNDRRREISAWQRPLALDSRLARAQDCESDWREAEMPDEPGTRYCGLIQLQKSSDALRIAEAIPELINMIDRWSKSNVEMLSRSRDGELAGFLFSSTKTPKMLTADFKFSPVTVSGDEFIVFEIGRGCSSSGWERSLAWIQRQ